MIRRILNKMAARPVAQSVVNGVAASQAEFKLRQLARQVQEEAPAMEQEITELEQRVETTIRKNGKGNGKC